MDEQVGELNITDAVFNESGVSYIDTAVSIDRVYEIINQLDEPEVLTDEQIASKVDQAYKDGYEKGKEHAFEKVGWVDKEPETVADVVIAFWKSYERLKEAMSMEVAEETE